MAAEKPSPYVKSVESPQEGSKSIWKFFFPKLAVREQLIILFVLIKVLPMILLAWIAWYALISLGTVSQEIAVPASQVALTELAVENIERITTDAAQKFAEFLYQRDADITYLARASASHFVQGDPPERFERLFYNFSESKFGYMRRGYIARYADWVLADCGMRWVQTNPYIQPEETERRSTNPENESIILHGTGFNYRPPLGFGDHPDNFVRIPLYDEIALLDLNGMQIAKFVTPNTTKTRFPFPEELVDVSDPRNTFVRAERFFEELRNLRPGEIYVSEVIGAYVPTTFIGLFTPNFKAARRIDTTIAAVEAEAGGRITETSWRLRVLNAELRHEEAMFNSRLHHNVAVRAEIDRRLGGRNRIWSIECKSVEQVSAELTTLGFPELAAEILAIPFEPEKSGYAGAENPLGIRFEGIVRWAKPVVDDNGEIQGYITFALNHDHLLAMIDHICPMQARFTELSDGFLGNYAFVWDYKCRSIVHPRHYSITGFNPETGQRETPWLEQTLYNKMIAAGFDRADWQEFIATLEDYEPFTGDVNSLAFQSRSKRPASELTALGLVGLDGRYLNNAPQCTGWMDLTRDGGSGSFYILWSDLYKLTTAAAIPYFTGRYCPEVRGNRRGFGFVTVGAGIDDFVNPALVMGDRLTENVEENIYYTTHHLVWSTALLSIFVIFIAVWMASYLSAKLQWLIDGITKFRRGHRDFRFAVTIKDEFGQLAHSFDEMAEHIVLSVHSPLVITDLDLNVIYANDLALELIGKKQEEIAGLSYKEISIYGFGSEYCPVAALHRGKEMAGVLHQQSTDNYFQGIANYLFDEHGEKQGYVVMSNDVTEMSLRQIELQRAKEEAELASQHKSRFLAKMSHELRTPMNAIIGVNEIAQAKLGNVSNLKDQQELHDNLADLKRSSHDLLRLLNDILEASNLESDAVALVSTSLDLTDMLNAISRKMKSECADKKLDWTTHFEVQSTHFLTDGLRLYQVLWHLFSNAIKYTPEHGKITFTVKEKECKEGKVLLSFAVKDTGVGIPEDQREIIFAPFEQIATKNVKYTSGSGLGLTIVRKILELFDTEITLQSEVGKGSEFSFDVWLQEEDVGNKSTIESATRRFTGQRALVVDDVRLNRIVLLNLLQEAGFTVDEAKDGKEGVEMFENAPENTYSIIFMDIQMPVMDGWEAASIIRNLPRADAKTVPIVTVSANAFQDDIDKSLANGMNAHYAKPIGKTVLSEILATFCTPTN